MRRGYSPAKAFAIELLETVAQERRASIRDTWGKVVRDDTTVIIVFYLHQDDEDASTVSLVREEQSQYNDIVLIRNEDFGNVLATGQAGVTQRVYLMMQHAQANYDLKLFMKADDDTFVNVPIMLNALRESVKDRFVYIGYPIKKTVQNEGADLAQAWLDDLVDEGDWAPTMSSAYMQGGAYILSKEAVDAIVAVNHATGLRYLRDEDHTVGTWVSPMHLKYLSGDDVGLFFWPWGFQAGYIQEAENYCQEAHQPIGWVHMLKKRDDMLEVFRLAQSCGDIPPSL
ncbi:g4468 [Coccomyxa viridis]|uniref:Hexosyltransferase n=1 Tax=Coccomyxa viridis TaxID=1274662 RepID=A0ABP1FRW1_9CHLO